MKALQQSGIFKALPTAWEVYKAKSGSVAVSMTFKVLEELTEGNEWFSWSDFEDHKFFGSWWVVKKDGTINAGAVEQLVECLGWSGNLTTVVGEPPQTVVQVTVKEEAYEGVTRYKGAWMNPAEFSGGEFRGADAGTVKQLQGRFGSLLRAAAGAAGKPAAKKAAKKDATPAKGGPKEALQPVGEDFPDDSIPF